MEQPVLLGRLSDGRAEPVTHDPSIGCLSRFVFVGFPCPNCWRFRIENLVVLGFSIGKER